MIKQINLGNSTAVPEAGRRMLKQKRHLPPGVGLIAHIKGIVVKNYSNKSQRKEWESINKKWEDLKDIQGPEAELLKYANLQQANQSTHSNIVESACAVTLLLKVAGHNEHKINGKMYEQIMKKSRTAIRKVHKEESIYHLDDLLKILDQQAQIVEQFSEDTLLGCTILAIVAFSELRLEEVMRATAEKDFDNSWSISTSIFKKPI
ncbi:MAG: hypothetical protein EZS28_026720 [Streblomastix strix]|uniref:Uncharacterized protein n=1 Tax=Streblomastix strix TaxID=222440 RepID=A0A5J4V5F0_9EUKA|nr:MAG: hypothetical protein EZS28_026720 [Streblomastix strix]